MLINRFTVRRADFPLYVPYELAFGNAASYETVLVEVEADSGARGYCDAVIITGYTPESIDTAYAALTELGPRLPGLTIDALETVADPLHACTPFAGSALVIAAEMASGIEELRPGRSIRCPILGLVSKKTTNELAAEIDGLLREGYTVFKVKVGFDLESDLQRVREIQRLVAGRARIRIDANQGYSRTEGCAFVSRLDPEGIELVEQTCKAGDWESAIAVSKVSNVPLMLDESIYDEADIDRAASYGCADYIKTKALKAGGVRRTIRTIERIRENGMTPVLGNGAALDLSCWIEAAIAGDAFETHGEMNGFLKSPAQLLATPLRLEDGCIVAEKDPWHVREDVVEEFTVEKRVFS